MRARFQFARWRATLSCRAPALLLAVFLLCPVLLGAEDAPGAAVGRIEGRDVSVEAKTGVATSGSSTVSNGNVITVHSGKARMTLFSGGEVEICGPAKFTLLLSGTSITLALNFGSVRAELPTTTQLRIFTPTIVGTPIDISGGSRDVTVGLSLDDSLCVLASSGAIQLEQQFTGEKIVVPQSGEFFINPGQLLPTAATPGRCQCRADEPPVTSEFATVAPSSRSTGSAAASAARATETAPAIAYSVLDHANQGHPVVASERIEETAAPPSAVASDTVVVPALVFTAGSPLPPPGPSEETILLVRQAQLSQQWEFSGRVEPPEFATAMEHALGETPVAATAAPAAPEQPSTQPKKKKGGFWAALKHVFVGGG
jgi:hypothetical protein